MIRFDNVHKSFGKTQVLRGISLRIYPGEKVSIIGPSGSGKSTLLRCINRLEPIDSGSIHVDGEMLGPNTNVMRLRQKVGFVFQSYNLFPHLTVCDNITLALRYVRGYSRPQSIPIARELLRKVRLEDKLMSYPSELSGGQCQRVAIARAVALDPPIMLFDEVTSALDAELTQEVLDTLREFSQLGKTMVIVTHEIQFAREISDRIIFLDEGQLLEDGPPELLVNNPRTERVREFFDKALNRNPADDKQKGAVILR